MNMNLHKKYKILCILLFLTAVLFLSSCASPEKSAQTANAAPETKALRILATSDLHGKFMPWDYALNKESKNGSMTQLAAAIQEYRTADTLLVDAGDTIQDNCADIFVHEDGVHPMIQAINALDYDVWVTGNHDYNYGMDILRKTISDLKPAVLTGNVYDESGNPIADGYHIFDVDGIKVAVIGMVTPNIIHWDTKNLQDCEVTDPLTETRKIIDAIQGRYDVLVGVFHMGIANEFGTPNSGVTDICNACPEFDLMVSSHEHVLIPSDDINGVLVVQNKNKAQTMSVIDMMLEKDEEGWHITEQTAESVTIADYEPDPDLTEVLMPYHRFALEDSGQVIGRLKGGPLVPDADSKEVLSFPYRSDLPVPQLMDTALIDLVNEVQMYYAGTKVSACCLCSPEANLEEGDIRKYDMARIYQFNNTLYKVHMNGRQLRQFMEWTAGYFEECDPEKREITSGEDFPAYNFQIFEGVCYQINVSNPVGSRIESLTWPDGTPVSDRDEFDIALNNYCAASQVLIPGTVYQDGEELPVLAESDIKGDIGGIRDLIREYIIEVKKGIITPECNHNWRIEVPGM